jgi:alpha-beta hydrolase superfamily lysophospholipase
MSSSSSGVSVADGGMTQAVSFTTEDGVTLNGRIFGSGHSGVILAHQARTDQTLMYPMARRLAQEGYLVLTFDFRGHGGSGGSKEFKYLDRDVLAAVGEIASVGAWQVVLVGASMGGTACLAAGDVAQMLSRIAVVGVVSLSAPVEFSGLSAKEAVPRLQIPVLFVAAEGDEEAADARELQELNVSRGELEILPGSDHGVALFAGSESGQAWGLLLGFLAAHSTIPTSQGN